MPVDSHVAFAYRELGLFIHGAYEEPVERLERSEELQIVIGGTTMLQDVLRAKRKKF